jgi:hypothetical protein
MKEKRSGLMRVHNIFSDSVKNILEKRKELGLKELSLVEITLLMTKHKNYKKIEADIINYLGYEDEQ